MLVPLRNRVFRVSSLAVALTLPLAVIQVPAVGLIERPDWLLWFGGVVGGGGIWIALSMRWVSRRGDDIVVRRLLSRVTLPAAGTAVDVEWSNLGGTQGHYKIVLKQEDASFQVESAVFQSQMIRRARFLARRLDVTVGLD